MTGQNEERSTRDSKGELLDLSGKAFGSGANRLYSVHAMKRLIFVGKLVVVTGASSGMGREIARALAYQEGADLVIAARRGDRLEALKAEIESRSISRDIVAMRGRSM